MLTDAPTVAQSYMFVVEVDTHSRKHVDPVIATGGQVNVQSFPTTSAGLARAVSWIARESKVGWPGG